MRQILFVCHGNTCRSPMAEYLFRDLLGSRGFFDSLAKISSAGLHALNGQRAADEAVFTLRERGIDMTAHLSSRLDSGMLEEAELVLTMTRSQRDEINRKWPEVSQNKVFTLKEYAIGNRSASESPHLRENEEAQYDILDPYGSSRASYDSCASEIEQNLTKLLSLIEKEEEQE